MSATRTVLLSFAGAAVALYIGVPIWWQWQQAKYVDSDAGAAMIRTVYLTQRGDDLRANCETVQRQRYYYSHPDVIEAATKLIERCKAERILK